MTEGLAILSFVERLAAGSRGSCDYIGGFAREDGDGLYKLGTGTLPCNS